MRTHRSRLALASASATGILLAIVFISVVVAARDSAVAQRRSELEGALNALAGDPDRLEVDEFRESHPEMSMAVFDDSGHVVATLGHVPLTARVGFHKTEASLTLGRRRGTTFVVVGADWRAAEHGLQRLSLYLGLLWLPLTCLCGGVTWLSARAVFRPLDRLSSQADAIGRSNLKDRLETEDHAEFGAFALQLNRMLDRIEASVEREEQFASDAAHELRTPLAIVRVRLESTLMRRRPSSEYVDAQREALSELERLSRVVESLLQSTRADAAGDGVANVRDATLRAAARWQDRFIAAGVQLQVEADDATAKIGEDALGIVLDNLLDNALRFSPTESTVSVWARSDGNRVELGVSDEGPGIDPTIGDHVFDRFVRADTDRNRASGGAGIGLSVCRRMLEARGGSITLREDLSRGATIVCVLKLLPANR